ncbi:MAG TPA: hypothetical protein VK631_03875 [Solirubrobacteraceae bacterium]|nr:hypothetical protein [Solirubrobacteraceae bacterium]
MKELVRRRRRPEHVVVDATVGNRVEDRLAGRSVPPAAPRDQQPALCVRMKVTRPIQQLAPGHPGEPLSRKNQGDLVAGSRKVLETGKCLVRRSHAHDAVMPRVAVAQRSLDIPQSRRILLNGDKHGASHPAAL